MVVRLTQLRDAKMQVAMTTELAAILLRFNVKTYGEYGQ